MLNTSANWSRTDPDTWWEGRVFHEAWADVIGYAVEWDNQSSGTDHEKADWRMAEDVYEDFSDEYDIRRVDVDDGAGEFKFHEADSGGTTSNYYYYSHPLSVAFYLMADGAASNHQNPWCMTDDENEGCGETGVFVSDIGINKASRIMFKALTDYAGSSSGWDHFGIFAKAAAFSLYRNCPSYNAQYEQESVIEAFEAIGYPAPAFVKQCRPF